MTPTKYRAQRTEYNGISFASKAEAKRYGELWLLSRSGIISNLTLQPRFPFIVNETKVCDYIGDFRYVEDGKDVVEDVKGFPTETSLLKMKFFRVLYPEIELRIIGGKRKKKLAVRHTLAGAGV